MPVDGPFFSSTSLPTVNECICVGDEVDAAGSFMIQNISDKAGAIGERRFCRGRTVFKFVHLITPRNNKRTRMPCSFYKTYK